MEWPRLAREKTSPSKEGLPPVLPRQHVLERQPVPEQEDVVEGERRVREARGQHVQQRRAHLVHDGPHQLLGHRAAARRQPRLRVRVFREVVSRGGGGGVPCGKVW